MIKKDDIVELRIEKLVFEGYALSHLDNFVVFTKGAIPNEVVSAKIYKVNKHFAYAEILEIKDKSPFRIKPLCNIYNACGACNLQYIEYNALLKFKKQMVEDSLGFEIKEIIPCPDLSSYRHKVQYPVSETKNSKRIIAGYYREKSHEITNIKYCMAHPLDINEIIQYVRDNWIFGAYNEKKHTGLLRHIVVKKSSTTDEILIIFVLNSEDFNEKTSFFDEIQNKFKNIKGILLNFNNKKTNKIFGEKTKLILGQDYYTEILNGKTYKIGAESFFQVNPKCALNIFNEVKSIIKTNSTVLDCYGGVGAIGVCVGDIAKSITLIELNSNAIKFAEQNFKNNGIKNYEIIEGDAKEKLKGTFDYSVIDPPRAGCDKDFLEHLSKCTKNIIYVSCNPSTLSRDIKILKDFDFDVEYVKAIDMFPFTYHIECVCYLKKK